MVLMFAYLSWPLALSFIGGKWSYCDWVIYNGANGCLSVLSPCCLIHSG